MRPNPKNVTVGELVEGYFDDDEGGVTGYDGQLNIRPPYQREFVYSPQRSRAVVATVLKGYPLNTLHWVKTDAGWEVLDGQQRTISIAQFVHGTLTTEPGKGGRYFEAHGKRGLTSEERRKFLAYELMVYEYVPESEEDEADLRSFYETLNIAGKKLGEQEILNAIYESPWVEAAKRWFSRSDCPAYSVGRDYLAGAPLSQDYLEAAIRWHSGDAIEEYMRARSREGESADAGDLWEHFVEVIKWVRTVFPPVGKDEKGKPINRTIMQGVDWGRLYAKYGDKPLDPTELENVISATLQRDDVTRKRGVYEYVLTGNEKHLNLRGFPDKDKQTAYERQDGCCNICEEPFAISDMEADHIEPWSKGGPTVAANCQMLCHPCHDRKGAKYSKPIDSRALLDEELATPSSP